MAITCYVEMRDNETWQNVAEAFLTYSVAEGELDDIGCHEGDPRDFDDDLTFAAISIPEHSRKLVTFLEQWATIEGRVLRLEE